MQPDQADEQLQRDVQDELRRAPDLDVSDIGIIVERGVVTLDGHVPSAAEHQVAEAVLRGSRYPVLTVKSPARVSAAESSRAGRQAVAT